MRIAVLAAGLTVALSLAACGDDEGDKGKVVEGTGYAVTVPDGWRDRSEEGEEIEVQGFSPDTVLIGTRDEGFATNVNIIRTPGIELDLDAQTRLERKLLEEGGPPGEDKVDPAQELTPVERTTVAGEEARAYEFRLPQDDMLLRLRQLLTIRDGTAYVITLTTAPDRFDEDRDDLDSILDSWEWD